MMDVFIISKYLLFDRGLEKLLDQKKNFKVIGRAADMDEALPKIKELRPNLVIIYDDVPDVASSVSSRQEEDAPTTIIDILEANPQARVVGLNVHNNNFHVYRATHQIARNVNDLVDAITA